MKKIFLYYFLLFFGFCFIFVFIYCLLKNDISQNFLEYAYLSTGILLLIAGNNYKNKKPTFIFIVFALLSMLFFPGLISQINYYLNPIGENPNFFSIRTVLFFFVPFLLLMALLYYYPKYIYNSVKEINKYEGKKFINRLNNYYLKNKTKGIMFIIATFPLWSIYYLFLISLILLRYLFLPLISLICSITGEPVPERMYYKDFFGNWHWM